MAYRDNKHYDTMGEAPTKDRFDPLLVCLHDSVREYSGSHKNPQQLERLVHSVAAILDAHLTDSEKILAADVLISLMKQAERDLCVNLSQRLAVRSDLPDTLLHFLAYGDIDIAESALLHSPLLSDTDLLYVVQSKGADHWRVIANRENISLPLVKILATKPDVPTLLNILRNETVEANADILGTMMPTVKTSEELAHEFVNYKGLPKDLAVNIYWHISAALRSVILNRFDVKAAEIDAVLEDCVQDFTDTMAGVENPMPSPLMNEVAAGYAKNGKITDAFLAGVLRRRQGRFFIALFSELTGLKHKVVHNMMKQIGGQGLAVACRAVTISKENFVSIFLLSRAIALPRQAVDAEELKMAMRYYDGLTHKMAKDILAESIAR